MVCDILIGTSSKAFDRVVGEVCNTGTAGNGGMSMDTHTHSFIGRLGRMGAC